VRAPHSADGLRQHRRFVHARQGRFSVPAPTKRRRFGDEQHGVAAPGRFEGWTERAGRRVHDHLPLAADRRLDFSDDRWCERLPVSSRPCGNRIGPASSLLDLPDRLGSLSDRIAHAEEPAAAVSVTELREDRHLLGPLEEHAPRRGVQDERYPAFPDGSALPSLVLLRIRHKRRAKGAFSPDTIPNTLCNRRLRGSASQGAWARPVHTDAF